MHARIYILYRTYFYVWEYIRINMIVNSLPCKCRSMGGQVTSFNHFPRYVLNKVSNYTIMVAVFDNIRALVQKWRKNSKICIFWSLWYWPVWAIFHWTKWPYPNSGQRKTSCMDWHFDISGTFLHQFFESDYWRCWVAFNRGCCTS